MRRLAAPLVALVLAGMPLVASAQTDRATISIEPSTVELVGDTGPQVARVTIRDGVAGTLVLSLRDAIAGADGRGASAPLGTSVVTLEGAIAASPTSFAYEPGAEPQSFTVSVGLAAGPVDRPRFGLLVAELTTPEGEVVAGDAVPIVAVPGQAEVAALPAGTFALEVEDLEVRADAFTIFDRLLPDLPGIVGHGPFTSVVTARNVGVAALSTRVGWTYHRIGLADLFGPESQPTLSVGTGSRFLVPGEVASAEGTSRITFDAGPIDAAPLIGLVRVRATVEGNLPGATTGPITVSRTLLVLPWSELLVAGSFWLAYRRRFGKVVDLRYSNEPIPIEPGAHRPVPWWRRLRLGAALADTFDLVVGAGLGKRRAREVEAEREKGKRRRRRVR